MLKDSKLYLILDTQVADYGRLLTIARKVVGHGVDMIQLRDKKGLAKDILNFSYRLNRLLKNRIPYIINDRVDLALAAGASGIHLGQEDLPIKTARRIFGKKMIIGASCQTLGQAQEAQRDGADYIGFGSVFKTLTKPHRRPMDLIQLAEVVHKIKIPVFAIGGIDNQNLSLVQKIGVRRVAVCRAICHVRDVAQAAMFFKESLVQAS